MEKLFGSWWPWSQKESSSSSTPPTQSSSIIDTAAPLPTTISPIHIPFNKFDVKVQNFNIKSENNVFIDKILTAMTTSHTKSELVTHPSSTLLTSPAASSSSTTSQSITSTYGRTMRPTIDASSIINSTIKFSSSSASLTPSSIYSTSSSSSELSTSTSIPTTTSILTTVTDYLYDELNLTSSRTTDIFQNFTRNMTSSAVSIGIIGGGGVSSNGTVSSGGGVSGTIPMAMVEDEVAAQYGFWNCSISDVNCVYRLTYDQSLMFNDSGAPFFYGGVAGVGSVVGNYSNVTIIGTNASVNDSDGNKYEIETTLHLISMLTTAVVLAIIILATVIGE